MDRYPDDNARVYKTVPLAIPTGAAPPAPTAEAAAADARANDEALKVAMAKEKSARQAAIRARPTGANLLYGTVVYYVRSPEINIVSV